MIRARFTIKGKDPRPVKWPIKYPYWCTGYDSDDRPIIVAYADNEKEIKRLWPDVLVRTIDSKEVAECTFTDRFPKPKWFEEAEEVGE